jgi:hypothetical protein
MSDLWRLHDHVCARCLGRVGESDGEFRCTSCGASCTGSPAGICACGVRLRGAMKRDAGLRCRPNPARSATSPAEIVVMLDELESAAGQ